MKFTHGQRVKCTIDGKDIVDAKISIAKDGLPFICQNFKNGVPAKDKLGYNFSWVLERDFTKSSVTNLRPAEKSFDNPEVGDVYLGDGGERTVLGVCGRAIFLSAWDNPNVSGGCRTKEELIDNGYTIKQDKEEAEELTMEEVCKQLGRTVKIKK